MFYRIIFASLIAVSSLVFEARTIFANSSFEVPFFPTKPSPMGMDIMADIRDFGDVLRETSIGDGLLDDPALTAVTREFGFSVISMKQFPVRSGIVIADPKPWSSWWFPKKDDFLFNNPGTTPTSVLNKYDWFRTMRNRTVRRPNPNSAADYERGIYNPNAVSWEGLCDAWAIASISKPEPKRPVTMKVGNASVTFSVGELKALLLKTYEAIDDSSLKYDGQKFTGDYNGWIFPDIFPDQFHRFLEVQLFGKKQSFIMDHDPGIEVWNVPVYKANFLMDAVPNDPNSVFVRTWLYSAESVQTTEKDFVGTREAVREYDYILTGTRNAAGDLVVSSGYWVKGPDGVDSRRDHPDFLTVVPDATKLLRKSWNPEIDIDLVDEILEKSY